MYPEIWGEYIWSSFHLIIEGYPVNPTIYDKKKYYDFFHSLASVLPCSTCSHSFQNILKEYPISDEILSNRELLILWGIHVHNIVNKKLGKKILSVSEAKQAIRNLEHHCTMKFNNHWLFISIIIIALILGIVYLKHK